MKRHVTILVATGLAAAAGVLVAVAPAKATVVGCRVSYTVSSQWPGGFTANVSVTNLGSPVSGWTLGFDFAAGQQVTQGWNAGWSQSGPHVSAVNAGWNGTLGTGTSTAAGFNGSWTGANPSPAAFSLNGVPCDGTVSSPSVPPTSPPPTVSPSASVTASPPPGDQPPTVTLTSPDSGTVWGEPGILPLAADASDPDGSITKVEFYTAGSGGPFTLVATVTTAPYTYQLVVPSATVFAIQARAYDNAGLIATDIRSIRVAVSDLGVTLTSPTSTGTYPEPGTIQLSAAVSLPPELITKVEFYTAESTSGPFTLVATVTTAPYTYLLTVTVPASVLAVQARAYDLAGVMATDTVGIHVAVIHPSPTPG